LGQLIRGPGLARRRAAKRLSYRIPARGMFRMVHLLVLKRGLLDGRAGIAYARMKAIYESMAATFMTAAALQATRPTEARRPTVDLPQVGPTSPRDEFLN
jgi:hypothetical protein